MACIMSLGPHIDKLADGGPLGYRAKPSRISFPIGRQAIHQLVPQCVWAE